MRKKQGKVKVHPNFYATLFIIAAVFALFIAVVSLPLNGVLKFFLSILLMGGAGATFQKLYSLDGFFGMNMWRSSAGLKFIDVAAKKNPRLWNFLADVGLVLAFGVSAKLLFKHVSWKSVGTGLALLFFFMAIVLPSVFPVALSVINFPVNFEQASSKISSAAQSNDFLSSAIVDFTLNLALFSLHVVFSGAQLLLLALVFSGGFVLVSVLGLVLNSALILFSIIRSLQGDAGALKETAPGASFIIPGINIPFVEGVLALAVLLVVHEGMHGILARIANNNVLSTGLVFFGVLPAGAFVEPDEKQLAKKSIEKQGRVLVAGSTANFYTALIFFFLFLAFYYSTAFAGLYEIGVVAVNANKSTNLTIGTVIYSINGQSVEGVSSFLKAKSDLSPNSTVTLATNNGVFTERLDENKSLGVFLQSQPKPGFGWLGFFYNFIALTFVLNFLVGSVNLLPIPLFDGYRLVEMSVKNKLVIQTLIAIVVLSFLLNFAPWVWN